MNVRTKQTTDRSLNVVVCIVIALAVLLIAVIPPFAASATIVQDRFVQLETARPSDTGLHRIGFTVTDFSEDLGSIRFEYCQNDPIIGSPCVPPTDFDATNVSIESQSGETGFDIHEDSDANNIILSRTPVAPTAAELVYELDDITNPSFIGSFYTRIYTYPTDDVSGATTQTGGVALSTNLDLNVEAEVPPYLTFCAAVVISGLDCGSASSFFINLGEFSTAQTRTASSQMVAATNAANGYAIRVQGTTLTSGNNTIPALFVQDGSSPGTGQFGLNLRNNSNPNVGSNPVGPGTAQPTNNYNSVNRYRFVSNDAVASSPIASSTRKFTSSYIINVAANQAPGVYSTTISYLALANF